MFSDKRILKLFHDLTEDCSILFHNHKIKCDGVFDMQIAHRIIYQKTNENKDKLDKQELSDPKKHNNISLNGLIKWYLNIDNKVKDELRPLMQKDIHFWYKVWVHIRIRGLLMQEW